MWILRWPMALLLLLLTAVCVLGAGVITGARLDAPQVAQISAEAQTYGASAPWVQAGLMGAAALMFLIAMIRLLRRTQGFWFWLIGFALMGAAWALTHSLNEWQAIVAATPRLDSINAENAAEVGLHALDQGVAPLAIALVVGLVILIVDAADRAHWDEQEY